MQKNLLSWYPIEKEQNVLLVADSAEQIMQMLEEKAKSVKARPLESGSLDEEPYPVYDLIIQIGVLEKQDEAENVWRSQIKKYYNLLKSDGKLLLTVPNRLGLKYFAGCQDEDSEYYFAGPQKYPHNEKKQALSRSEYRKILREMGFASICEYYPYPDYVKPTEIYSEKRIPAVGELAIAEYCSSKDRYLLFDEKKVFDSLINEEVFATFANSYLFVCGKELDSEKRETVIYSKYSLERANDFQIRTDIVQDADGNKKVRKVPMTTEASAHVHHMVTNCSLLNQSAKNTKVKYCEAFLNGEFVEFEWAKGTSLLSMLQTAISSGDIEKAEHLLKDYAKRIRNMYTDGPVDIDLIPANVFVEGENWTIIDYEWTFSENIPVDWILYRAMLHLSMTLKGYDFAELERLLDIIEVEKEKIPVYEEGESKFQSYLKGDMKEKGWSDTSCGQLIPFEGQKSEDEKKAERLMNVKEKDAKKLFYHLDRVEEKEGKIFLFGWACARTRKKEFIPVHLKIFDQEGNCIPMPIERLDRKDVAKALNAKESFSYWGFQTVFQKKQMCSYTLRMNSGTQQQEILLETGI